MDLLKDFKMVHIIRKMLVLIKNHLNYLKDNIFELFFKKRNRLLLKKLLFFSKYIMMENTRSEEEKIIKDIRNVFRLKKELNDIAIKDIRNLFRGIKDIVLRDIKSLF